MDKVRRSVSGTLLVPRSEAGPQGDPDPLARRQWLEICARYSAAAIVVIGSCGLLLRHGDPGACKLAACGECRDLAECGQPQAVSRRAAQARREESRP